MRSRDQVRSDINMTPLVDVCLVLLIIFMVVNDRLSRGQTVPLPATAHHTTVVEDQRPIVSLTKAGAKTQIWWDRDGLHGLDDLKQHVADARHRTSAPVVVKADADLSYGDVYPVLIAMHEAGAPGVELATRQQKEQE
jgi:biopolymer transport protein ExbD